VWGSPHSDMGPEPRPNAAQILATRIAISSSVSQVESPTADLVSFEWTSSPSKSTSNRSCSKPTVEMGACSATAIKPCSLKIFCRR